MEKNAELVFYHSKKKCWDKLTSTIVSEAKILNATQNVKESEKLKRKKDVYYLNRWIDFRTERTKVMKKYVAARKDILRATQLSKMVHFACILNQVYFVFKKRIEFHCRRDRSIWMIFRALRMYHRFVLQRRYVKGSGLNGRVTQTAAKVIRF